MSLESRNKVVALLLSLVLISSESRATWNQIARFSGKGRVNTCYFFDANTGLIAFNGPANTFEMLRTTDGGVTWNAVVTPSVSFGSIWFGEIWFKDAKEGWAD